jgi:hypothetical protein
LGRRVYKGINKDKISYKYKQRKGRGIYLTTVNVHSIRVASIQGRLLQI